MKIDELIRMIEKDEALDLPGTLSREQEELIKERIFSAIQREDEKPPALIRRKKKRTYLVLLAAVVLLLAFGLTAAGAGNPDWDIEIIRMMGLENTDTLQLEGGEVKIDKAVTVAGTEYLNGEAKEKEMTITALTSVGDKNSACIHVTTDYKLPEGFDEKRDYIMPHEYAVEVRKKEGKPVTDMGSTGTYLNENGYLSYLFEISNCKDLNKSYVTIRLGDFYWHRNPEEGRKEKEELLLEGVWTLTWKFEYKSNAKNYPMLKRVEIDETPYYITKVELSPISVRIEGFRKRQHLFEKGDAFSLEKICYEDGTCHFVAGHSSAGCRDGIWVDTFFGMDVLKQPLMPKEIKSLIVAGKEIKLK